MLVNVLILFFLGLILYQIFLANTYFIEGLENNSQATNTEMQTSLEPQTTNTEIQTSLEQLNSEKIDLLSEKVSKFVTNSDTALDDINLNFTRLDKKVEDSASQLDKKFTYVNEQLDKRLADSAAELIVVATKLAGAASAPTKTT
jgi:hypothetical protein